VFRDCTLCAFDKRRYYLRETDSEWDRPHRALEEGRSGMNPIKLTVNAIGLGRCALTGRECDGVTLAFENEPPCFLSWKALRQLVSMKGGRPAKSPAPGPPLATVGAK
jgi:hypothetical protein